MSAADSASLTVSAGSGPSGTCPFSWAAQRNAGSSRRSAASGAPLIEMGGVAQSAVPAVVRGVAWRDRARPTRIRPACSRRRSDRLNVGRPSLSSRGGVSRTTRLRVSRQASVGFSPRRMPSTVRNPPHTMMFASPRPVEPAAPTSLSVYWPAPTIGESPPVPESSRRVRWWW